MWYPWTSWGIHVVHPDYLGCLCYAPQTSWGIHTVPGFSGMSTQYPDLLVCPHGAPGPLGVSVQYPRTSWGVPAVSPDLLECIVWYLDVLGCPCGAHSGLDVIKIKVSRGSFLLFLPLW